jgi:pyruvate formate lyase activating enzyme
LSTGIIFDIRRFSIHDGPGIRTTVFMKGCPLSCPWCHNPEGIDPAPALVYRANRCLRCGTCLPLCPQGAIGWSNDMPTLDREKCIACGTCVAACYAEARELAGREMTVGQVVAELERDRVFYDQSGGGVTFSGGEPLLQAGFLLALLQECRASGLHTALDTCGFAPWEVLDRVRESVDLFLYDVKLIDEARHRYYTGVSNAPILDNLQALAQRGQAIVLRVPILPGINDDEETVRQIGALAASLPHLRGVDLLPYHRAGIEKYGRLDQDYRLPELCPPSAEQVEAIAHLLAGYGLEVRIGG